MWQILKDDNIDPAPKRSEVTWTKFLRSQAAVACDFFTFDTATLRHYYVLFFIHVKTRQVIFAGLTAKPPATYSYATPTNSQVPECPCGIEEANSSMPSTRSSAPKTSNPPHAGTNPNSQHVRRTLDRHPAPRTPRPNHHLEPPTARTPRHRLHRPLQRSPTPPLPRTTTA